MHDDKSTNVKRRDLWGEEEHSSGVFPVQTYEGNKGPGIAFETLTSQRPQRPFNPNAN